MNRLQQHLLQAGRDLGIKVIVPYIVEVKPGVEFLVEALLPELGNYQGMLVTQFSETYRGLGEKLVRAGYGYTTYHEPKPNETFDHTAYAEMFSEWGWNAENSHRQPIQAVTTTEVIQTIKGFPAHQVRGPEVHPSSGLSGELLHAHVGSVDQIPILDSPETDQTNVYGVKDLSDHSVVISSFDPRFKIAGIKVILEETGMGLAAAKNFIENLPDIIKTGLDSTQATNLVHRLNQAHVEAEIRVNE